MLVRSRIARPASPAINFAKAMGHTAILWAVFFLGFPAVIHWVEDRIGLAAGRFDIGPVRLLMIAVFFGAAAVGISGGYRLTMLGDGTPMPLACTRRLVIAGPYCYIRNPMAAMGILQGIAIGLYFGSWPTILYALTGAVV